MRTFDEILLAVSQATLIPKADILSVNLNRQYVRARQLATFLLVDIGGMTKCEAGRRISNSPHTGNDRYDQADILLEHDARFRDQYQSALWKLCAPKPPQPDAPHCSQAVDRFSPDIRISQ